MRRDAESRPGGPDPRGGEPPSRVLLVTNEYPPEKTAGTAMATRFLAEELARRGCRVSVVVNTRRTAPRQEADGDVRVVRLRPAGIPLTRMLQRAAMLTGIARQARPHIIQGQSVSSGALAAIAGGLLGIPSVTYVQGLDLYQAGRWAERTYIRWTLRRCDSVAAVTGDLQARALHLSGRRAEVIPHGLKLQPARHLDRPAARSLLGLPPDAPIVLFAGRLIALKGVEHLIRAMPQVRATSPDARLVIVGNGEDRLRLGALAGELGGGGWITFAGERPHEDVIRFMRAADLFVLPSLVESFGIVLLEAMGCGLPVVASDVMGIPSLVEDPANGFLVPPGDPGALARRITGLLGNPTERAAIGARNVEKADRYALPHIADRFLDLWARTIDARRAHAASRRGQTIP